MLFARSAPECRLYIDLHPCLCGATEFDVRHTLTVEPDGSLTAFYHGSCPQCGSPRAFVFTLDPQQPPPLPAFGGPAPSRIICPGQFALVADRAARHAAAEPAGLSAGEREASLDNLELALAATEEVLKFIPFGTDAVPDEAFTSAEGKRLQAEEPERFRRYRLEAVAGAYRDLVAGFLAAGPA